MGRDQDWTMFLGRWGSSDGEIVQRVGWEKLWDAALDEVSRYILLPTFCHHLEIT